MDLIDLTLDNNKGCDCDAIETRQIENLIVSKRTVFVEIII